MKHVLLADGLSENVVYQQSPFIHFSLATHPFLNLTEIKRIFYINKELLQRFAIPK